ncbi:MAG: AbrB/MazE/SpoVT family DNA-binding domain-containing protein [Clostridia bacterium]|nr:AbrB/MazE/SpoVT family DNA-binding domain-containing protein [Clostridia bacterium]MBQ8371059.1 AbrB/MazE/SpoVT family DNA-binding domain-containing protein [Clostridia bacterium]MBQ8511368.1 AbrB/MazE/SpoVT family DNA-binding domain-containing protein [Clostridia bacterium]
MKSLGIVRRVDELGRIVLPIETRKRLGLDAKDPVEIFVEKDRVILKKYEPCCIFCGDAGEVVNYKEKKICKSCLEELKAAEI